MGDDDDPGSGSNAGDDDGSGGGTGPAKIELSTTTIDFGLVSIAAPPRSQTVTVKNIGGAAASPTFALAGDDAASFALGQITCGATLEGGASCTVEVSLNVGHDGAYQATLDVTNADEVASAALLANSQSALLALSPPTDDFHDVNLSSSQTHTYTLTNTGDAALPKPTLSVTGTGYAMASTTCSDALAAGQSCTFSVKFAPTAFGTRTAVASATAGSILAQSAIAGRGTALVTVTMQGSGGGSVSGLSCSGVTCTTTVDSAALSMTAVPSGGSRFSAWGQTANCPDAACAVTLAAGTFTTTVTFDDLPTLTVGVNTAALGGSVSLSTGATVTSGSKSFDFSGATTVTLSADTGSENCNEFQGWGGDCLGSATSTTCTITVSGNSFVSAGFGRKMGCIDN